ncbi:uncharacterized protein LOC134013696 [Osmerus eperlanus]|uniref:uncharacterized protein LOC134013695 n=1 Tax=Osmerus eperlanus TaxID=29151 RepID=UPI002E0DA724
MSSKDFVKATNSLSRASDFREDTAMLTKANANWEEYLTPAPMSIAFLGELVFISANQDFSIKEGGPVDGFKLIKYPDSFRACLMQVCNSGWRAFNEAHKSMDKICLHTRNVPTYMKRAVQILIQEDDVLIENLLPDVLENIATISQECVALAKSSEKRFTDVTELISELLETCTSSKQHYGKNVEDVRRTLDEEKQKKHMLEEEEKQAQEEFKKQGKLIEEANRMFQEAMDSLPSGWDIIGMNFVEELLNSVNAILGAGINHLTNPLGSLTDKLKGRAGKKHPQGRRATAGHPGNEASDIIGGLTSLVTGSPSSATVNNKNPQGGPVTERVPLNTNASELFTKASLLLPAVQSLSSFIQEDQIQWTKIVDPSIGKSKCDWIKEQVENVKIADVKKSPAKLLVENIRQQAKSICSDLTQMAPEGKHDDSNNNKALVQRIKKLMKSAQQFDSMGKKESNTSSFPVKPPAMAKAQSSQSSSASETATQNARFRIEQMRILLDQAKEDYEKSLDKMEQKKRELTETLIKLRSCEVKEIDFETTIRLLAMGLKAMGSLQEKWHKMVQFFQMISNIIDTSLKSSLKDFVDTAKKPYPKNMKYSSKMFLQDVLYQQAFQASNIANLVNMISGTYTEISSKYLMDRVGSLGRLMALDPKDSQFEVERQALAASCDEAGEFIQDIVQKNKKQYELKTKARLLKIENELNAVLPPPSKEEQEELKEIRDAVTEGFKDHPDIDQFS